MKATNEAPPARRGVRREQLSDEVAAHLRRGIMSGVRRPGTFIRLAETAAELGVSITPVREALRTLRSEGMVKLEPHRGHMVASITRGDIEDIIWLQAVISAQLARSAAERITDDEIDDLERLAETIAIAIDCRDTGEVLYAEFAFHRAFTRASGQIKLAWFLSHTARYLSPHIHFGTQPSGHEAVAARRNLIAALRRRDTAAVEKLISDEFTHGAQRLTERLDQLGLLS
ncbi:GntR family transcriptional regulator [soil metagenome]